MQNQNPNARRLKFFARVSVSQWFRCRFGGARRLRLRVSRDQRASPWASPPIYLSNARRPKSLARLGAPQWFGNGFGGARRFLFRDWILSLGIAGITAGVAPIYLLVFRVYLSNQGDARGDAR